MEQLLKDHQDKMGLSQDHLLGELAKLRTGQASLAILEGIKVDFYGTPTPLSQTATLGVPDSSTITIQPWDASVLKDIEKAISASDLGLTPNSDGKMIRLQIPPLTQERRQQLAKVVKKYGEECRIAIRNIRRDFNDKVKAQEKNHEISADECHKFTDKMQKITDSQIGQVDKIVQEKEKNVLAT
jgi:ribosome recycling factor